ncbi:Protein CBG10428 [Caenorhabditis briggsae]|uniref:ShKT domain-containing protein n=2 Tax=Caenorhabditis briggsae TaxID=6238 RepID=A0AAE9A4P9_CAEBR|nr:Protein CBG10428 [Caenorhabditis briggsae]ULT87155.1 hypothetical protein L3Y34_006738 [Caenorhabditis briggsae]CAP29849.2 Protein CBG10428 [Caenorhabditis briggsae]
MILLALALFPIFSAIEIIRIKDDHNCTEWNPNGFVYSWQAVACQDVADESYCKSRYPSMYYPAIGGGVNRPMQCYTFASTPPGTIDEDAKAAAIALCPKTCGYCCQTHAFNCQDKNVNMACWTVTQAQCVSPQWRDFLAEECPATCGYCGDCYDLNPECPKAPEVCTNPRMQDYVNLNCRRTCKRCTTGFTTTSTQRPTASPSTKTSPFTKTFTRPLTNF